MATIGFPKINLIFKAAGVSAVSNGNGGVVALMLKDVVAQKGTFQLYSVNDIPAGLSATNKDLIAKAFLGGVNTPTKIIAIVKDATVTDWAAVMTLLESYMFNLVACPEGVTADNTAITTWVKDMRNNKGRKIVFVGGNIAGDHEGVVNFATEGIVVGSTTYTAQQYTARIAGLIAGTPYNSSITFYPLSEVTDLVTKISETAADTAIGLGKLVLIHDGEKVKIARGVNSLQTVTADKSDAFKKIKIVATLDKINNDIKRTAQDSYIGRVPNSYENKLLLINAINAYFSALEDGDILDKGKNRCEIDIVAQKQYLAPLMDINKMTDVQVKVANTGDKVYLTASCKPLDAMEDITFVVNL
jgi:hypothetical protein